VGVWSALRLPIDAVPDITNVQVQINTQVPALAPEEIEKLVTFPIETEMGGIAGVTELRSLSRFGLSQVTLVFKDGTDIYRARQLVSERLQNAMEELPSGVAPKLAPISTGLGEIFYYVVEYDSAATNKPATRDAQLMELKQIHDLMVKPRLRSTPGLAEVNASGGYDKQFVVQPDPQKLRSVGLTFGEVADVIAENLENAGGSVIQVGGESVAIRAAGRVQSLEEIADLPLKFGAGVATILVRDVAEVAIGRAVRTGAATYNGEEVVLGAALMLAGDNSRIVARAVGERLKEIQTKLPSGVVIKPVYDRTVLVDATIWTVEKSLFEGAVLVVVILFLMLGNWRAAVIVAMAIPLSLLFAMTGMVQGRVSGNLMSLGAIDFGLIVDGSVVMVENILRHLMDRQRALGRRLTLVERVNEVLAGAREVVNPMFFGVLIITVVYVPILALTGIEGKMFRPMALTVIFALVGSLALALTLMPVLCSYFLRGKIREHDNWLVRFFKALYTPLLTWALRFKLVVVAAAVVLFGSSLFVFTRLGAEFIPQLDEGTMLLQFIRSSSAGLGASTDLQQKSEKLLLEKFPEIDRLFGLIGTAEIAVDPMGANLCDTYVELKPRNEWRKIDGQTATKEQLIDLMRRELAVHAPGQTYLFTQPIQMRFNEMMAGVRADIAVKVYGDDFKELERLSTEIRDLLRKIPGSGDVEFDAFGRSPLLEIKPDRDAQRRYNMQAGDLNHAIATALAGEEVGSVIEGNRRFPHRGAPRRRRAPQRGHHEAFARANRSGRIAHARPSRQVSNDRTGRCSNARSRPAARGDSREPARARYGRIRQGSAGSHQNRSEVPARLLLRIRRAI
jgi:cobalt-zinc-cadmium resistance protein CzcA